MVPIIARIVGNLVGRVVGPLALRFIVQPLVAATQAVRAGLASRGTGHPPNLREIATNPAHRRGVLREGWKALAKVFVVALVLDVIYQVIVFQWVYPFEALLVAFLLTCVPYLLTRGPAARLFRGRRRGSQDTR
jgi:hypothetical protein